MENEEEVSLAEVYYNIDIQEIIEENDADIYRLADAVLDKKRECDSLRMSILKLT